MTTVYDVPADKLIAKAATELKEKAEHIQVHLVGLDQLLKLE